MPETRLSVRVRPGASRNEIKGFAGEVLRVNIAAPPEKGRANAELVRFLSAALGVDRQQVSLLSGQTGRSKVVAVQDLDRDEILKRLNPAPKQKPAGPPASRRLL